MNGVATLQTEPNLTPSSAGMRPFTVFITPNSGLKSWRSFKTPCHSIGNPSSESLSPLMASEVSPCVKQLSHVQGPWAPPHAQPGDNWPGVFFSIPRQEAAGF